MPTARIIRTIPIGIVLSFTVALTGSMPAATTTASLTVADESPAPDLDSTYYANALGKTGTELRVALHSIISVQTRISYSQVWTALQETDQDPDNADNVLLLYSGQSRSKNAHGGNPDDWNREHVWAQSHGGFGTATGPGTDIHHLRPADVTVNAERGNKDFDDGGSPVAEAPGNFTDSNSWEAHDTVKGDVARMVMYMAIRYEGDDGWPDLELNDEVGNGSTPRHGRLSVLLSWHGLDPPDAFEQRRNQVIQEHWQGNRNPFIDHPEWATAIWD